MNGYRREKDIPEPPGKWESNYKSIRNYGWILSATLFFLSIVIYWILINTNFHDELVAMLVSMIILFLAIISIAFTVKSRRNPNDMWKRELPYDKRIFKELDEKMQSDLEGHNLSWEDFGSELIGSIKMAEVETEESTGKRFHKKFKEVFINKKDLDVECGMFILFPNTNKRQEFFFIGINNITPENSQEALDLAEQIDSILDEIL